MPMTDAAVTHAVRANRPSPTNTPAAAPATMIACHAVAGSVGIQVMYGAW